MKQIRTNPKLFIIDDDEATRILIAEILDNLNVDIVEAECGKAALELFKMHNEDVFLVLLDIRLPDCTGWELVKQLRVINSSVSIVALSALSIVELAGKIQGSGFNSYLSKPFDINDIERLVKFHTEFIAVMA